MSDSLTLRLARPEETDRVIAFINENFDWKLPLVNRRNISTSTTTAATRCNTRWPRKTASCWR